MIILQALGKESDFTLGHKTHKDDDSIHTFSLIFIEYFWHTKTKRWGVGIGIPFVYAIGFCV